MTGEVFLQGVQGFLIATYRESVLSAPACWEAEIRTNIWKDFDADIPGRNEQQWQFSGSSISFNQHMGMGQYL